MARMNYVGNISIMDRGDAPAQAVLDRNARSLSQRVAEEAKEELHRVLDRVDHVSDDISLFLIQLITKIDLLSSSKRFHV